MKQIDGFFKIFSILMAVVSFNGCILLESLLLDSEESQISSQNATPIEMNYVRIDFDSLRSAIRSTNTEGVGFIVDAFLAQGDPQKLILFNKEIVNSFDLPEGSITLWNSIKKDDGSINYGIKDQIESGRIYTIYIGIYSDNSGEFYGRVDKIDGLMTPEEASVAKQKRLDDANAALALANQYNPADFILVPEMFKPADYKAIDLFDAVARINTISRDSTLYGPLIRIAYVSDVIFVSQNGINIVVRTSDNAIIQEMTVNRRLGIAPGTAIRLYYLITKPGMFTVEWDVVAVKKE